MNSGDSIVREKVQTRFEQKFFLEWISHLHGRTIFTRLFGQFTRRKRGASKAVATCFGADVKDGIADAFCSGARELLATQDAEAKDIYQGVALETFIEINLATDCGDADAVSVVRDSGDDAGESSAVLRQFQISIFGLRIFGCYWSEPQRVEAKFRAGAHGENVANDSADSGGGALEWFNRARMIVALHLERDCPTIANVHYAGVFFAGFHQNVWRSDGKFLQFFPRILLK